MDITGGLGRQVIWMWRAGERNPSVTYAQLLVQYLRAHAHTSFALAAEIDQYIKEREGKQPYQPKGFAEMLDRDGNGVLRDGRGKGKRPKVAP